MRKINAVKLGLIILLLVVLVIAFGCSGVTAVTAPGDSDLQYAELADDYQSIAASGTNVLGIYGFEFDEKAVELAPVEVRGLDFHYNATGWTMPPACGGAGCLTYVITGWDPVNRLLTLDATIENPTGLTAYDARLIFQYFIKRVLVNADSYTPNFAPAGQINPFIAFAKTDPNRAFGPSPARITEKVEIYWPTGAGGFVLNIVEGCWPGHCAELYEINNISTTGPILSGGTTDVFCDVLDWQGDVVWVGVDTTPLTGGWTGMANTSGNTWKATVSNTMGAAEGDYTCWINARSNPAGPPFSATQSSWLMS